MRRSRVLAAGVLLAAGVAAAAALRRTDTGPVLGTVTVGMMPGMVAVDERTNRAFVTNSADHTVSVLDDRSGAVLHTVTPGDEPDIIAADVRTGRIFALSDTGNDVDVLDARSGAYLSTTGVNTNGLTIDDRTGRAFVWGAPADLSNPTVAMLDGRNGSVLHTAYGVGAAVWGGTVDSSTHRLFITDFDGDVVDVVDTITGRVLRSVAVGSRPVDVAVDVAMGRAFVANNGEDTVTMLDARTGAVLRTIKVGPNPARAVVDERTGRVFVIHGRGGPRYSTYSSLAPFAGISTRGTTVLDARSGAVLRQVAVGGSPVDDVGYVDAYTIAVDERRGRVFVINQTPGATLNSDTNGSVSVLDGSTGRLLRTLTVGRHPIALAVDETTGRLFVVNTNSGCAPADRFGWIPGSIRRWLPLISQPPKPTCGMPGSVTVIDTTHL